VGEALAEARYRAGLTVDEVAERTRIREAVIRCIEQDDYDACGGDLYVRGYVRAIAGAVGIDAQPLIREFDTGRVRAPAPAAPTAPHIVPTAAKAAPTMPAAPAAPLPMVTPVAPIPPSPPATLSTPAAELTATDLPVIPPDPGFDGFTGFSYADPALTIADPGFTFGDPGDAYADHRASTAVDSQYITPERVSDSVLPGYTQPREPSAWSKRLRGRRWLTGIVVLVAAVLVVAGVAGSHIVSSLSHNAAASGAGAKQTPAGDKNSGAAAPSASTTPTATQPPATKTPQPVVNATAPSRALHIASAAAFGPDGTVNGDNPQTAMYAITPGALYPWATQWYATPDFGRLRPGTGLLLDLGKTVTITSVRIYLSGYRGANLQLRTGNATVFGNMPVVARASDAAGTLRLRLKSAVHARYVLIWFTLLPPDGMGHFQENVYRVVVNGRP
jgi:cytoskeletal protein RodZ